jgi:hypothetical protein
MRPAVRHRFSFAWVNRALSDLNRSSPDIRLLAALPFGDFYAVFGAVECVQGSVDIH